jgi:hypothetical protein
VKGSEESEFNQFVCREMFAWESFESLVTSNQCVFIRTAFLIAFSSFSAVSTMKKQTEKGKRFKD